MPPGHIRTPIALLVPKEEAEAANISTQIDLSRKTKDGESQVTVTTFSDRRSPIPLQLKRALKSDTDVKPLSLSIPDIYPQFALQDTKPKVKQDPQDPELANEENAIIVTPKNGHRRPAVEVVLTPWKDVRKAKADRARAASAKSQVRSSRNAASACAEAKVDLSLRDMADFDPPRAALRGAVEELKNPDAKVKQELLLSDEFLLDALTWEGINHRHPVPLPKAIAEFPFSRAYISHLYGGNPQDVFPPPSRERVAWHGLDDWAFLSLAWNPHAPTRPGCSGLYFTMDSAATCDERATLEQVKRTFVRLGPNRWIYLGQYAFTPGVSLTAALWTEQRIQVRRAWARGVLLKGWGEKVLLRIWFRRERGVDFEPDKDDMEDAKRQIEQIRRVMSEEDVMGAYDRGEEEIGTFRMVCTGYDAEFLRILQRNAHSFVPPPPKPKNVKAKNSKPKQGRDTSPRGAKRKAGTPSDASAKGRAEAKLESGEDDCQKAFVTTARANNKRRKLA